MFYVILLLLCFMVHVKYRASGHVEQVEQVEQVEHMFMPCSYK